ncbi:MAG: DUF1015 family protein, partial [Spirochaetia bacterium]|nr:DUF1015 family protein [Spirochaetia bacterium]
MAHIQPFRAVRPKDQASAATLASVPYDVVDAGEAAKLADGLPLSFLRVTRSEIELSGVDPYSDAVYQRAASNMKALLDAGHLVVESEPCLY